VREGREYGWGLPMRRWLKFLWLIFLSLGFLLIPPFSGLAQHFTIQKFHSDIFIYEDSSVIVKERIEVEFHQPRHGIYREIPFRYRDDLGKEMTTPLKVFSVTNDSESPLKYQVKRVGSVVHIRIGDPKRYVRERQVYLITYRVKNAILFFEDHDEFYWNVTGNDWKAPIQEASANVYLETKEKSKKLMVIGYEGGLGSREECGYESYDNTGKFFTKRALKTGEGLTLVFGWDKGLVSPPSSWEKFFWALHLEENWVFLLPFLSLFYMVGCWYKKGRDPRVRESVMVMYGPPNFEDRPLIPAEIGALIDEKIDPRDMSSTIVDLAVKGYLKIEETKREGLLFDSVDYYLRKVKDPDAHLQPFEIELMKSLFHGNLPGVSLSELKNRFYTHLPHLKETLFRELIKKRYFPKSPERVRNTYMGIGVFVIVIGILIFLGLLSFPILKGILVPIGAGLPFLLFGRYMPAKTKAGALAYMESLGFQEFLSRAEKDRIEKIGDRNLFSKFLPYAIALDVVESWSKAFEGIYQDPPQWYVSTVGFREFSPYGFSRSIQSVSSHLSSAMFSAPRGSGSSGGSVSGGGFSGGGFGGGGGGSW
jgi:uncharacterized membrane protein